MAFRVPTVDCIQCATPMQPASTARGSAMVTCATCGGSWMEVPTFLAELRHAQPKHAVDELLEHNDGTPRRPCPRCAEPMAIVWLEFLQLDQCAEHGVWLDRGELDRALRGDFVPKAIAEQLERARKRKPPRK